jgi:hypothetical protein
VSGWTVAPGEDGGTWEIRADGRLIETVRSHYDAREVLAVAERLAGHALSWRLDRAADGFVST